MDIKQALSDPRIRIAGVRRDIERSRRAARATFLEAARHLAKARELAANHRKTLAWLHLEMAAYAREQARDILRRLRADRAYIRAMRAEMAPGVAIVRDVAAGKAVA